MRFARVALVVMAGSLMGGLATHSQALAASGAKATATAAGTRTAAHQVTAGDPGRVCRGKLKALQ
ncbi:MAG TPA: hypothetical protein VKX16_18655 [Chloroflexota bacterium]|nr:hypothetical protein [Chloroflexota bacterium]